MRIFRSIQLLFAALALSLSCASFAGFSISNGQLVDNNGTPFIMRGMAYPYAWFTTRPTQQDIANMAATGANTVRFVLGTGAQFPRNSGAQVAQIIQWAKDNRMIAVLEVHDSTGWTESAPAAPITNAVAYWTSSDIRAAINGQENFVIINIANEPFGNNTTANFTPNTISAIQSLRNAGLTHTLMVDAANWGQDWSGTMRTNAMQIWNADTRRNLVFSVHMYEVYAQSAAVVSYMQAFDDLNLPLVIGEFGADHQGQPVDEGTIMAQAQQRGNGYIGWSWSGNGGCCVSLDIVNNFSTTLTSWGQILVNGANGIRATSRPATVFGGTVNNLTASPTSLSFASGASSSPVAITANVSWTATDNQTWITVTPTSGANNGSLSVSVTANTGTAARAGTVTVSGAGISRAIAVSQAGVATPGNNLTVSSASVSLGAAASTSSPVAITANVSWTVTDDQTWLSASPTAGSGNGAVTLSATANTGAASRSGTVTVAGGGITRTIAVTQAGTTPSGGTVTATAVVTSSSPWFSEEQLRLSNTANITALTVTITVQRTTGVSGAGQYNSIGGTISQTQASTAAQVVYTYTLNAGQTISPGTGRTFAAQMSGNGTAHPTAGDTYTVTGTAGGSAINLSGHF